MNFQAVYSRVSLNQQTQWSVSNVHLMGFPIEKNLLIERSELDLK